MPKVFTSKNQKIGELGEDIACKYLLNKGFTIVERNYTRKWGEIDIVAAKDSKTYFVEVKSKSIVLNVSGETQFQLDDYRPEDGMHPWKLRRLSRVVQTYLLQKDVEDWQFDLVTVYIDQAIRKARVKVLSDIVL